MEKWERYYKQLFQENSNDYTEKHEQKVQQQETVDTNSDQIEE